MQQVTRKTLGAGINLTCVTTPKFKRAVLRAMLVLPLGGEDAALRACLPQVLRRGTARLNDMQAFGTALDELYGARIEAAVRKEGENLCIGFLSDCIDEAYAPGADGVDEIDPQFNAIKGGGGALYREKVVASMAKEVIWIMDESKLVDKIGAFHLPVEIAQYGSKQAMERMAAYGWNPVLRVRDGKTFVTDNGNFIADLHLGAGFDIQDVYSKLTGMLGVLEHGLFLNMCKRMIVGHSNGEVQVIENPSK